MDRFDGAIACKVSHNLFSCNPPRASKLLISLVMTLFVGWAAHQTVLSVGCNPDFEILTHSRQ